MNTLILRNALTAEESNIRCVFFVFFITYTLFLIQLPIGNTLVTLKVCEELFSCCRFGQKALHQSSPLRLACQKKNYHTRKALFPQSKNYLLDIITVILSSLVAVNQQFMGAQYKDFSS